MANVELYTKGTCPYCIRAKAVLEEKGVNYNEIRIDQYPERRDEMIQRANGGWTVPQIFINDKHIGGCDDMMMLESRGQLDPML